jgi:hypothetical protein
MSEIGVLVKKYSNPDGRARYRDLWSEVETVFTSRDLEKDPLQEVKRPSREFLHQGYNILSPREEAQYALILTRLRNIMKERRLLLAPFFKDFDKVIPSKSKLDSHLEIWAESRNLIFLAYFT